MMCLAYSRLTENAAKFKKNNTVKITIETNNRKKNNLVESSVFVKQ